ncbi:outer membrane beta-barrel protein [bacterium]|nr:outer membrane beta-barrel protein [candidate division CSSED10-310 bacterium]
MKQRGLMKQIGSGGLIALLALTGWTGSVCAQYRGGRYAQSAYSLAYEPGVIQITPFGGFLIGDQYDAEIGGSNWSGEVEQDDSAIWGIRIGFGVARQVGIEFQVSHASTTFYGVTGDDWFGSRSDLGDADVYHVLGNVNFDLASGSIVPYLALGLGTTVYDLESGHSDSEFTGTLAGGLKARIASNIALRFEIRGYVTQVEDSEYSYYWDGYYYEWENTSDDYLTTIETSLGLSFIL